MNPRRLTPLVLAGAMVLTVQPAQSVPAKHPLWSDGSSIAFMPNDVRIGAWPVQVGTLPREIRTPFLFNPPGGRAGSEIPLPDIHNLRAATLSPNGKRIAYAATEGVVVADLSGRTIGVEKDAVGFRWSPDGESIALLMGKSDSRPDAAAGLGVWDLRKKTTRYHRRDVDRISWGAKDTLYYAAGREFWAIQPGSRSPSRTGHHGIEVSPDGLYSLDRPGPHWSGSRIIHDRTGVDQTEPTYAALGPFAPKHTAQAFWVPEAGHLLCLSACGYWPSADSTRWECRTAIVDVLTSELLAHWSGMSLGPSADGRSVWITDGYDVRPLSLKMPGRGLQRSQRHPDEIHY